MIAARAKGLGCLPMSGFSADAVNAAFFAENGYKANFICSLGYRSGDEKSPRLPRLDFDEACMMI